jgi:hypothetical protein
VDTAGNLHDDIDCARDERGIEDLGSDVRVIADEAELAGMAEAGHRPFGLTVPYREPKFRVGGASAHFVMGMYIDARIEAQNDLGVLSRVSGHALEVGDFKIVVDGDEPHTGGQRLLDLGATLIVAVKNHLRGIDPGVQSSVDLAARYDIEPDPLLDQNAHQRWREIRFARVDESRSFIGIKKGVPDPAGAYSQGLFAEHIEGCAELAS